MGRLSENSVVSIKNRAHSVTAEIEVAEVGADGVIVAQGGSIGGWSLYLKDGKPRYCYNLLGLQRFYVGGDDPVPAGRHQVRMEFDYHGPGLGKGGTATLFVDGVEVGSGEVAATAPMIFSADDTCDVGRENGALVADDYPVPNTFTGTINWVEIDVGAAAADADHRIDPDELFRVAMARQ
jgi:arylsulfatase